VEICQKGDQLLEEEIAKVYKGKKIAKGKSHCPAKVILQLHMLIDDPKVSPTPLPSLLTPM
jgi:hypothetical protein